MSKPKKKKVLFLYFELAGYVVACMERLAAKYDVAVHVVRYPVNAAAPFQFNISDSIVQYDRSTLNNSQLIALTEEIKPDFVYVCGWADKGYIAVCKHLKKRVPVVMTLDNPWLATAKQYLASVIGKLYLHRLFTHCWVPGEPNAKYARKLGFKGDRLLLGMYSADVPLFASYYKNSIENKKEHFPHRFIFVGRYVALKGVHELWEAFSSLSESERKGWELWCLGKGTDKTLIPTNSAIVDCGFVQPSDLDSYLSRTGVFILPTHYEHWGVVVHEFAAAGFPMICSTTTSAATAFLQDGFNGFFCEPHSVESIRQNLLKIINKSDSDLLQMGQNSTTLANKISPNTWSDTIYNLIK